MDTTDTDFNSAHAFNTAMCVVFGVLFVSVGVLSTMFGDRFINIFFGG